MHLMFQMLQRGRAKLVRRSRHRTPKPHTQMQTAQPPDRREMDQQSTDRKSRVWGSNVACAKMVAGKVGEGSCMRA